MHMGSGQGGRVPYFTTIKGRAGAETHSTHNAEGAAEREGNTSLRKGGTGTHTTHPDLKQPSRGAAKTQGATAPPPSPPKNGAGSRTRGARRQGVWGRTSWRKRPEGQTSLGQGGKGGKEKSIWDGRLSERRGRQKHKPDGESGRGEQPRRQRRP